MCHEKKLMKICETLLKIWQLKCNALHCKSKQKTTSLLHQLEQSARVEVIYKYLLNH